MAATPGYGGTNGVAELDLGQPGSARYLAGTARYIVTMKMDAEETREVVNKIPQQSVAFHDHLGPIARFYLWEGTLKVIDIDTLHEIEDEISQARDGYARSNGVLGAFDPAAVRATRLRDGFDKIVSERARIADHAFVGRVSRLSTDTTFGYVVGLRVRFRTLG
jgi:hypothetical protein